MQGPPLYTYTELPTASSSRVHRRRAHIPGLRAATTMSDREFGGNDDLSLPKGTYRTRKAAHEEGTNCVTATVQKIINEILANDSGVTFAKDTRDLLIECCVEFITLISSEANEIAEKDAKKTIACEHVKAALEELGFGDYVPAIMDVAADYKKQQAVRAPCVVEKRHR